MRKTLFFMMTLMVIASAGCKKDKSDDTQPQVSTKTFVSVGAKDGIIVNSSPRIVKNYYSGAQGKEITMGWDANGYAMRGFLYFDISSLNPASGYILKIDEANLRIYEANTNLNPFSGQGAHMVDCYLVDYVNLTGTAYDDQAYEKCGTIATDGYSVLTEHSLIITSEVSDMIYYYPSTSNLQFRLQFTNDNNVPNTSTLTLAMWNIFSGDDSNTDYLPQLDIKYHYEKK